jgi:hypothetical protein
MPFGEIIAVYPEILKKGCGKTCIAFECYRGGAQ